MNEEVKILRKQLELLTKASKSVLDSANYEMLINLTGTVLQVARRIDAMENGKPMLRDN